MWEIKYNLKKMIHVKTGYEYITSKKLCVPVEEIGLNILVRKQQQLSFFYEIILKLIKNNISSVKQISEITGIEEDILCDVIGDMSVAGLVHAVSNNLKLTLKGKEALENLIQVSIEKDTLRKVFVDCITGQLYESIKVINKVTRNNPWLEREIQVNEDFIQHNFNNFNNIYIEKQEEYSSGSSRLIKQNEIYQILNKEYGKIFYLEKKINIFKNLSDGGFSFETEDEQDDKYITSLREQIDSKFGARELLKSKRNFESNIKINFIEDENSMRNTIELTNAVMNLEKDAVEEYYFKSRYLYEGEVKEILLEMKNSKPSKIIIHSSNLREILSSNIIEILYMLLDRSEVIIIADENEWEIKALEEEITNKKQKKKNKIIWKYEKNIKESNIILYPYASIKRYFIPIEYEGEAFIIKEVSEICFDRNIIDKQVKDYM